MGNGSIEVAESRRRTADHDGWRVCWIVRWWVDRCVKVKWRDCRTTDWGPRLGWLLAGLRWRDCRITDWGPRLGWLLAEYVGGRGICIIDHHIPSLVLSSRGISRGIEYVGGRGICVIDHHIPSLVLSSRGISRGIEYVGGRGICVIDHIPGLVLSSRGIGNRRQELPNFTK